MQETQEHLGEASPVMIFPQMIETVHLNRQRKNHRRQLEHDRAIQAAALRGDALPEWSKHDELDEDDEMGDTFSISGDTIHHHHGVQETPKQPQPSVSSGLAKAAVVAAGLLGAGALGAGIPWMAGAYNNQTHTTIQESQDMGVGVEVVPGGAQTEKESE